MQRQTVLGWLDAEQQRSQHASGPETKQRVDDDVVPVEVSDPETRSRGDEGETAIRGDEPHTFVRGEL
jgi:hypothetical protein